MKEQPWFPYAAVAAWGLVTGALVLVNSGSVVLAVLLGLVVAAISWRIDRRSRDQSGGDASS